jgi:NitT/TauT family transport system ATP-binding protein
LLFPTDVKAGQLATFLRVVSTFGGSADVARVSKELDTDLTQLIPILDAAELLGLIVVEKGDVKLTEEGQAVLSARRGKGLVFRDPLAKVEPFRTALTFKGKFTAKELANILSLRDIRWHHEDEVNTSIIGEMLIHWGIPAGFFEYDGSDGSFVTKLLPQVRSE